MPSPWSVSAARRCELWSVSIALCNTYLSISISYCYVDAFFVSKGESSLRPGSCPKYIDIYFWRIRSYHNACVAYAKRASIILLYYKHFNCKPKCLTSGFPQVYRFVLEKCLEKLQRFHMTKGRALHMIEL